MTIEYEVSDEVVDLFEQLQSAQDCRDACVKNLFGWKRASYFAKKAVNLRAKAWRAVHSIYPELKGLNLNFSFDTHKVTKL